MKTYLQPSLIEYGTVTEVTLGTGGDKPDFIVINGQLVNTGTTCADPSTNTTACLIAELS